MLNITAKCEFKKNFARLTLNYTNKTSYTFQNLQTSIDNSSVELKINVTPCETTLVPSSQIQQLINVECVQEFSHITVLTVQFK